MSEELLGKLRLLEDDYASQPPLVQQADLREINRIRAQLGMLLVDAHLHEIGGAPVEKNVAEEKPSQEAVQDHSEAREIYQAYLKRLAELEVHRTYAYQVAEATAGHGQTPVRPLATLGTNGGPLLCDHCGKPIVLEGGRFHGVAADIAWKKNPQDDWTSWILGGMVVEIQTNETLRIYHGYPGQQGDQCCNVARQQDREARARFDASKQTEKRPLLLAFLDHDFPDLTRDQRLDLLSKILDTLFSYDPGIGVNRPGKMR